ncbi:P-loop containing nucleoside triphosphate hydrolase protein [Lipomyces arxii]|uniref:P-loop containing nucleoside triphosphate hydrolase protein n=1 Tax=Lipomyces arxii TaxID=56418 RepID=UPI0034CF5653
MTTTKLKTTLKPPPGLGIETSTGPPRVIPNGAQQPSRAPSGIFIPAYSPSSQNGQFPLPAFARPENMPPQQSFVSQPHPPNGMPMMMAMRPNMPMPPGLMVPSLSPPGQMMPQQQLPSPDYYMQQQQHDMKQQMSAQQSLQFQLNSLRSMTAMYASNPSIQLYNNIMMVSANVSALQQQGMSQAQRPEIMAFGPTIPSLPSVSKSDTRSTSPSNTQPYSPRTTKASSNSDSPKTLPSEKMSDRGSPAKNFAQMVEEDDDDEEWMPDIYASRFVPAHLKNINNANAVEIGSQRPPNIDLTDYVDTFAPRKLLARYQTPPFTYQPEPELLRREFGVETYKAKFDNLISIEIDAKQKEMADYNMYGVTLELGDAGRSIYKLKCPGIREFTPSVSIGDVVFFRQLGPQYSFNGFQHNGHIWYIDRARGEIFVRIDGLFLETNSFNVRFSQDYSFEYVCADAVKCLHQEMKNNPSGFARKMLFPLDSDGVMQNSLANGVFDIDWYDADLNFEQQRAVDSVLSRNYGQVPFLISGPPGTGKTKTVVELALQLLKASDDSHILLCAPSDAAADTLAMRLRHYLDNKTMFRLNGFSRSFSEISTDILPYCAIDIVDDQDMFGMPDFQKFMSYRIVVCACKDANILTEAKLTNQDLFKLEGFMTEAFGARQQNLHWTALLIDEAGQGTEPETIVPLRAVLPGTSYTSEPPVVVMAGDQKQLGPRTASRQDQQSELEVSLFERLTDLPFYSEHPLARKKQVRGMRRPKLPFLIPAFSNLVRNYRSHPALLAVPSSLFYYDTLLAEAVNVDTLCNWHQLPNHAMPMLFIENKGIDEMVEDGVSWYNNDELKLVCDIAKELVDQQLVKPFEIAIAVPFREQIRRIRNRLRAQHLRAVNVGPVESYQGAEHRVVIVCTTRTRERFLERDLQRGMGMMHEAKRFNVAITRAKELLVVVGNSDLLAQDSNWRALLSYSERNGLCDPSRPCNWKMSEDEANTPAYFSRIEQGIVYRQRAMNSDNLNGPMMDDPMWLAGAAAEEVLLNE